MISVLDILSIGELKYANILNSVEISKENELKNKVESGDLVFVRSSEVPSEVGWVKSYNDSSYALFSGFTIRGKRKRLYNPFFLELNLNSKSRKQIEQRAGGSTRYNISQKLLRSISVHTTKMNEQNRIAYFINKLDKTIELHQRKIQILQRIKREYLQEMLANTEQQHPNLRFNNFEDTWENYKLKEVILNEFKGKATANMSGTESIYLDTNYLNGGEVSFVDSSSNVTEDDVIMLWDGSQAGTVYHGFRGALGSTLKAFTPIYSGTFVYLQLLKNQNRIYNNYRTPNIPHVIKSFSEEFLIPIGSQQEQNKISTFLNKLEYDIKLKKDKLDTLIKIKEEYLKKMFI